MEFVDDYRLLISLDRTCDRPSCLALVDTEKVVGGAPTRKTFHLFPNFDLLGRPFLLLEQGVHKPSPAETLAPFYQDPIQRIAALFVNHSFGFPAFRVGMLLELAEGHEGSEVGWDEWKGLVVNPSIGLYRVDVLDAWVSGCRLFYISATPSSPDAEMRVFDFSIHGRRKHLIEHVNTNLGGVRTLLPTDARAQVPRSALHDVHSGHDSIVLTYVSVAFIVLVSEGD